MSIPADIVLTIAAPPSDAAIALAYQETGSVWLAAAKLGISGQLVHRTVKRLGVGKPLRRFTDGDRAKLTAEYDRHASAGTLSTLAAEMGRTKQFLCRQAKAMDLTAQSRKRPYTSEACSIRAKDRIAKNGHPRGFEGKSHSAEARKIQGQASLDIWAGLDDESRSALTLKQMQAKVEAGGSVAPQRPEASWKAGWREIGGQRCYFRSAWEANYARYLEWLRERGEIQEWRHEPEVFWFEAIRQGVRSYKPDFRVVERNGDIRYHEVKGWMDSRSRTCLARMGKYHPSQIIILIDAKVYRKIASQMSALLPGWEEKRAKPRKPKLRLAAPVGPLAR